MAKKRMIQAINEALDGEMAKDPKVVVFGEDVEISLFGDTSGLKDKHGAHRVRNMPISETVMSGMAVGAAAAGYKVVCHMMFGNFMYTGFDSIANQASKLRYMTAGQIALPIVYMGVFGGGRSAAAQHSDAMHPMIMNLGGIKVALPATPADAMGLLRSAIHDPNPVMFLQAAGRGGEQGEVPDGDHVIKLGKASTVQEGDDVTVVAIGAMVRPAMRAAQELARSGIGVELIDPRTVVPLDSATIFGSVRKTGRPVDWSSWTRRATCVPRHPTSRRFAPTSALMPSRRRSGASRFRMWRCPIRRRWRRRSCRTWSASPTPCAGFSAKPLQKGPEQ
ncbi:MAG: alpha-ketoacid dehydrogenase subunit beta [Boseongicola sp.]|nr:alpha-ketoacid dehydrogenase subunit beta [Boseongicola sp.]